MYRKQLLPLLKAHKMNLYVKNMVCIRCKMAVQAVLEEQHIPYHLIELGKVTLAVKITEEQRERINSGLLHYQLELMEDKKKILVEQIKVLIIGMLNLTDGNIHFRFTEHLSKNLFYDYTYLANTFSEVEGHTIEKFFIVTRIERVKELIVYQALSLTDITYQLNFSSVSHLCLQFKKVTGQTPSMFRKLCESQDYVWRVCE